MFRTPHSKMTEQRVLDGFVAEINAARSKLHVPFLKINSQCSYVGDVRQLSGIGPQGGIVCANDLFPDYSYDRISSTEMDVAGTVAIELNDGNALLCCLGYPSFPSPSRTG